MPLSQVICLDPTHLHATDPVVEQVDSQLRPCDRLIAVGSCTIHDITRYTAHARGIDFVSVPTAASEDGYLSSVAAMTWHNVKRTFPARAPIALVADSDVIAAAPYALTASGVGDLLGKYTAIFDWRAAHVLTGAGGCDGFVNKLEEDALNEVVSCIDAVRAQDTAAVESVMYGLILSGLAMQMVGNSRPASGSEHHISHLIEMNVLNADNEALHGEKVGVAEAVVCDRYHDLLSRPLTPDRFSGYAGLPEANIRRVFRERADEVIDNENTPDPLADLPFETLAARWDELRRLAEDTLPTGGRIRALLAACGASVTLSDIGLDERMTDDLCAYSPFVRRRLTFMRCAMLVK